MKIALIFLSLLTVSCSSFKAERVDAKESDERALEITDNWVSEDTRKAIKEVIKQMEKHPRFKKQLKRYRGEPKVFVAEVQNNTSEAYFPIGDMNDELLFELSNSGEFVLVDAAAREKILDEITYQNDGMVDPATSKQIGKQLGADLMIFGNVYMKPEKRDGKTIKEYSVNLRMTDIQKGIEVLRTRTKVYKYSDKSSFGW
ncbi:MAG: hypothetical protein KC478_15125 [Bacteriovoracaceae bacterium]|nr:hypothetical protein [Bacteriovoracaceae bacterium]